MKTCKAHKKAWELKEFQDCKHSKQGNQEGIFVHSRRRDEGTTSTTCIDGCVDGLSYLRQCCPFSIPAPENDRRLFWPHYAYVSTCAPTGIVKDIDGLIDGVARALLEERMKTMSAQTDRRVRRRAAHMASTDTSTTLHIFSDIVLFLLCFNCKFATPLANI